MKLLTQPHLDRAIFELSKMDWISDPIGGSWKCLFTSGAFSYQSRDLKHCKSQVQKTKRSLFSKLVEISVKRNYSELHKMCDC